MIDIQELYDAVIAQANSEETGLVSPVFNSFCMAAELDILDWLTGKEMNGQPTPAPAPFLTQKNKDFLLPFIVAKDANFKDGIIPVPEDYYTFQSLRVAWADADGAHDVDLINSNKVANRKNSKIKGISPTTKKPITEIVNGNFFLHPEKMDGQSRLIYIRYPVYGKYITKIEPIYKQEVIDTSLSKNLEWPEALLPYFMWRINHLLNIRNRETDAYQMNQQKQ